MLNWEGGGWFPLTLGAWGGERRQEAGDSANSRSSLGFHLLGRGLCPVNSVINVSEN